MTVRVMAAVIHRHDHYLVCRRPAHKQHGGLWEFPGGKCEDGESDAVAIERELHEELGVRVLRLEAPLFVTRDPGGIYEIVFVPVEIGGDPVAHEHEEIAWYPLSALRTLALAPSDAAFVASLSAGLP